MKGMPIALLLLGCLTAQSRAQVPEAPAEKPVLACAFRVFSLNGVKGELPRQLEQRIAASIAAQGFQPVLLKDLKNPFRCSVEPGHCDGARYQEISQSGEVLAPLRDVLEVWWVAATMESGPDGISVGLDFTYIEYLPWSEGGSWGAANPLIKGPKTAGMIRCAKDQEAADCLAQAFDSIRPQFEQDLRGISRWVSAVRRAQGVPDIKSRILKTVDTEGLRRELHEAFGYIKARM